MRQIILDTETTGLRVEEGHRIIEIGCIEMVNRKLTGNHFHCFINPDREVEAGALAVHGITNQFLADKPFFEEISQELMDFISGAELIIHNAPFDVGFLNHELILTNQDWKPLQDYCGVVDTLQIARQMHSGQRNSLDALCKRYGIDNSKRDLHGALLDANLLAQVYLIMTGGQGNFFDALLDSQATHNAQIEQSNANKETKSYQLIVLSATEQEEEQHQAYLDLLKKKGLCIWQ